MTRLPHESRDVRGVEIKNPPQILEEVCSHPYCNVRGRENLELHELWSRSFLRKQPIEYVKLWNGTIVRNQVYLCNSFRNGHHLEITENKARIRWLESDGPFPEGLYWYDPVNDCSDYLDPQPLLYGSEKPQEGKHPLYGDKDSDGSINVVDGLTEPPVENEIVKPCSRCGGSGFVMPAREKALKKEKARNRVSKSIRVPKDKQENGVEVLEGFIEQVEEILRPGEKPRSPYYTLTDALGLVIVNKDVIL
jgi:hypothetical protein